MNKPLQVKKSGERELEITRYFDAPRDLVFDALTKPDLIKKWLLGPDGWELAVCEVDLKVGGDFRYVWRWKNDDKKDMGMGGTFKEISAPDLLVHTEVFDDAWYPGTGVISNRLIEEGKGTMLVAICQYESREAMESVFKSPMESGLSASYDRLEKILLKQKTYAARSEE